MEDINPDMIVGQRFSIQTQEYWKRLKATLPKSTSSKAWAALDIIWTSFFVLRPLIIQESITSLGYPLIAINLFLLLTAIETLSKQLIGQKEIIQLEDRQVCIERITFNSLLLETEMPVTLKNRSLSKLLKEQPKSTKPDLNLAASLIQGDWVLIFDEIMAQSNEFVFEEKREEQMKKALKIYSEIKKIIDTLRSLSQIDQHFQDNYETQDGTRHASQESIIQELIKEHKKLIPLQKKAQTDEPFTDQDLRELTTIHKNLHSLSRTVFTKLKRLTQKEDIQSGEEDHKKKLQKILGKVPQ
jgi:hypothetical protein